MTVVELTENILRSRSIIFDDVVGFTANPAMRQNLLTPPVVFIPVGRGLERVVA